MHKEEADNAVTRIGQHSNDRRAQVYVNWALFHQTQIEVRTRTKKVLLQKTL